MKYRHSPKNSIVKDTWCNPARRQKGPSAWLVSQVVYIQGQQMHRDRLHALSCYPRLIRPTSPMSMHFHVFPPMFDRLRTTDTNCLNVINRQIYSWTFFFFWLLVCTDLAKYNKAGVNKSLYYGIVFNQATLRDAFSSKSRYTHMYIDCSKWQEHCRLLHWQCSCFLTANVFANISMRNRLNCSLALRWKVA